jgi:hypothetical protein
VRQETSVDRVREYLGQLTPLARSSLLTEIERLQLYGEDISAFALILTELRAEFRRGGETNNRIGNPSRHFFKPIEALFVDRPPERANPGQISRGSLSPIWEWINHDLLPTMARDYCETMKPLLVAGNIQEASKIAASFQSKVVKSLEGTLSSADGQQKAEHGLAQYTSSHAAISDLKKVLASLQVRDAIAVLSAGLPEKIDRFDGDASMKVQALLDAFVAKNPQGLPFALVVVMKRLKQPWLLAQLPINASFGKTAEQIATTRYAPAVGMAIDYLDERHWALKQAMKHSRTEVAKDILNQIYDIESWLHDHIAGFEKSDWGRRLEGIMATLAADLEAEFRTLGDTDHIDTDHIHHVLAGIAQRRHGGGGLLNYLSQMGRDVLAGGAAYYGKLVGSDDKKAG